MYEASSRNPIELIGLAPELILRLELNVDEVRGLLKELYLGQVWGLHPDLNGGRNSDRLIELNRAYDEVSTDDGLYRHMRDLRERYRSFHGEMQRLRSESARIHAQQAQLRRLMADCVFRSGGYRSPSGELILFDYGRALNDTEPFFDPWDLARKAVRRPEEWAPELSRNFIRRIGVVGRRITDVGHSDRRERQLVAAIVLEGPSELAWFPGRLADAGLATKSRERPPLSYSTRSFGSRELMRLAVQPGLEMRMDVPMIPRRTFLISAKLEGADATTMRFAIEGIYLRRERRGTPAAGPG